MICFIWPASVFWGPKRTLATQKAKGVSLGFCQGNLMFNEDGVLLAEGRKQVYVIHFHSLNEIKEDMVRALLFEAGTLEALVSRSIRRASGNWRNALTSRAHLGLTVNFLLLIS